MTEVQQTPRQPELRTIVLEPRETPDSVSLRSQREYDHDGEGDFSASNSGASSSSHSTAHSQIMPVAPPLWTHRVSASFSALAEQIGGAAQAIALIPPLPDTQYQSLNARLEEIERVQHRLELELQGLKDQVAQAGQAPIELPEGPERVEKALKEHIEEFKLEQSRLPARLHNATVTVSKVAIKPLAMPGGKMPPNFPATRGEFEHLTRERYEQLMKGYGIPIPGPDRESRREALRVFLGLPALA